MRQRDIRLLVMIILVAAFAAWVSLPANPGIHLKLGGLQIDRVIKVHQGLDLQGGMEVLLEADPLEGQTVSADAMASVRGIVENRVNGLGVTEPVVQSVGTSRILVQLPGIDDPVAAAEMIKETGQMEWVDTGVFVEPGTRIRTNLGDPEGADPAAPVYTAILTGKNLKSADVAFDQSNLPVIAFELDAEGGQIFAAHTAANVGRYLAIVLDKEVISCPRIHRHSRRAWPDHWLVHHGRGQVDGAAVALWRAAGAALDCGHARRWAHAGRRVGGPQHPRRGHRPRHRAAVHADLLPTARAAGRPGADHLCADDFGALQAHSGDAHLARHRRLSAIGGHGRGCQHPHL